MDLILFAWLIAAVLMALMWAYQSRTANASHVDVAWAYGIGLVSLLYFLALQPQRPLQILVLCCALVWSLRLGTFLLRRLHGKPEDSRYQDLRQRWGKKEFFVFYQFQALAVVLFSIPIWVSLQVAGSVADIGLNFLLGLLIAMGALFGESVADKQLENFKKESTHSGKTCRVGLWRYSRHPNYFFEWLYWFSFVAFAWGHSLWALTLLGPLVMLILLFGVTGIPPSEARALKTRGEDYREYQKVTSVFIPWFPKPRQLK